MPPCQKVLQNKIKRTITLTRMTKSCNTNQIELPAATDSYCFDGNNKFVIKYFFGLPYPADIEILLNEDENEKEYDRNSSDDEDYSEDENHDGEEDVDWLPEH